MQTNLDDIFAKHLQGDLLEEKKIQSQPKQEEVKPKEETNIVMQQQNTNVATKQKGSLEERFLAQIVDYAQTSGEVLDNRTKSLAVDIITATNKVVMGNQYRWSEIDIKGCGLISQIKRWAKLGVSMEDKLYPDIRKNGKTGLYDIKINPQYQTLEKLMRLYFNLFNLEVLRFKEDIICVGDELIEEEDFNTGLSKITGHKRNNDIDRNNLDNIIGAYKIMYIKDVDNNINQYAVKIDKNRINRAYNASPSREKTVWKLDSAKMVKKTCTWEMWNDKNIRAFMNFPDSIINDLSIIDENNEMDWNAETKFNSVDKAQENVQMNVANGEVINASFDDGE